MFSEAAGCWETSKPVATRWPGGGLQHDVSGGHVRGRGRRDGSRAPVEHRNVRRGQRELPGLRQRVRVDMTLTSSCCAGRSRAGRHGHRGGLRADGLRGLGLGLPRHKSPLLQRAAVVSRGRCGQPPTAGKMRSSPRAAIELLQQKNKQGSAFPLSTWRWLHHERSIQSKRSTVIRGVVSLSSAMEQMATHATRGCRQCLVPLSVLQGVPSSHGP